MRKYLMVMMFLVCLGLFAPLGLYADNMLEGVTGYTFTLDPNRGVEDTPEHSKLTDTEKAWDFTKSLRWYLYDQPGQSVEITFDMGVVNELQIFKTFWVRWDPGSPLPDDVEVLTSMDGVTYSSSGHQSPTMNADKKYCAMSLALDDPLLARYVRVKVISSNSSAIISLLEVEAWQPAPLGNMVIGYPYALSATPNGAQADPTGRKLTDGIIRFDPAASVQWDQAGLPEDSSVQVTVVLDRVSSFTQVSSWWYRDEANGFKIPEIVNVYGGDGSGYTLLGAMSNQTNLDGAINRLAWQGQSGNYDHLAVVFNRATTDEGVMALVEVAAQGRVRCLDDHNEFGLGFVLSLTAGSDVYFRPADKSSHVWLDPPASDYPRIVEYLHDHYYANTLYVQYNGEVDRATALDYFAIWKQACDAYGVELVPVLGLIQWDYLENVNAAAEFGDHIYDIAPIVDITNTDARSYFRLFINDLLAAHPDIERLCATDINQYSIAKNSFGYTCSWSDLQAWTDTVLADIGTRKQAMIFEQPGLHTRPEMAGIRERLLDTYSYLLYETYGDLAAYVANEVSVADHVEGDLVIVTDPGARMDAMVQLLAARAIESAGGHLSLDIIITATVTLWHGGENFWFDLLDDGYYQGYYALPMETVRQRYRLHHGEQPEPQLSVSTSQLLFTEASGFEVDVALGDAPTQQDIVLSNMGTADLNFSGGEASTPGLAITGGAAADFHVLAVSSDMTQPLVPGASLTITIQFAPLESERTMGLSANLQITSDDPMNPSMTVELLGDAVPVGLSAFIVQ